MKNHQTERDNFVVAFHVQEGDDAGLRCPLCRWWSPIQLDSPQGIRLRCDACGTVAIMPRVPLVRAIKSRGRPRR